MHRFELPIFVPLALAAVSATACTGRITGGPYDDVEAAVVVLEGDALDAELGISPAHESPEPFVRLGFVWDADRPDSLQVSTSVDGVTWSDFSTPIVHDVQLEQTGAFVGQVEVQGEPARWYRLRGVAGGHASFLRLELLTLTLGESVEEGDGTATPTARTIGTAEVHPRSEWGARSPRCTSSLGSAYRMAIHHTETPTNDSMSPQARLRQIQSYHMDVKGWCDIGYHYLVSRDGRVWEGRKDTELGSHAGGANTGNIGISIMGSHDATPVTQTQVDVIAGLVRSLAIAHDVPMDRTRIKGHREYKSTSCPGDALFAQL